MVCMYARMSYGVYSIYVISLSLFRMSECFERACFSLSPYPLHPPTYLTRTLSFSIWYTQNTMQEALCCTCLISSHTHACVFIPLSLPLTSTHISHSHTHACVWEKMRQLQHVCACVHIPQEAENEAAAYPACHPPLLRSRHQLDMRLPARSVADILKSQRPSKCTIERHYRDDF